MGQVPEHDDFNPITASFEDTRAVLRAVYNLPPVGLDPVIDACDYGLIDGLCDSCHRRSSGVGGPANICRLCGETFRMVEDKGGVGFYKRDGRYHPGPAQGGCSVNHRTVRLRHGVWSRLLAYLYGAKEVDRNACF